MDGKTWSSFGTEVLRMMGRRRERMMREGEDLGRGGMDEAWRMRRRWPMTGFDAGSWVY